MSYFAKPRISQDGYDIKAGGAPDEIWRLRIPQGGYRQVALCCARNQIVRSNNPNVVQAGDISESGPKNTDIRMLTVHGRSPGFTILDCVPPGSNSPWGSVQVQVVANMSKGQAPSPRPDDFYELDDDNFVTNPKDHSKSIDAACQAVGYGIYNGGFYVYVPQSISPLPFLVPENLLWFGVTKSELVTSTIFHSQAEAIQAVGGTVQPDRVAYFWGKDWKLVCPTAFTSVTAPTIVNTASFVVDELVREVQDELIATAIPIVGGIVGRGIYARLMKARKPATGAPPRMPQKRLRPAPTMKEYVDLNPKPTSQEAGLGRWLDEQAQSGRMGVVKRVRGMPEGAAAAGNPDYHLFFENLDNAELRNPSLSPNLRGDAVIAESNNIDNIISNAASSKSGRQADVVVIEIGSRGRSGQITNEAVRAWKLNDIKTTFPRLRRLIVVRNSGGTRSSVLDLEVR